MWENESPLANSLENSIDSNENDELLFADEIESVSHEKSWKVLIVDDESEVHTITKLALTDFVFEGKALSFLSAYSAQEAKQLILANPDTAVILLDVVMETEDAGLRLVNFIRDEIGNQLVRIILRTGQPGRAPDNVVVVNYGIDDYKTKTELTSQKLLITIVTALRTFSALSQMLEMCRTLELEIIQQRQIETMLRSSEMRQRKRVHQLEQSLQSNQKSAESDPEALVQFVDDVSREISNSISYTDAFYTVAIVTRIAKTVLRITDEYFAQLGISQTKLAVLSYLASQPEQCATPSALAKHCEVSRAAMTGLLDGLQEDGYVERDSHPSDRRALRVKLTAIGQQFLDSISTQEEHQLLEMLNRLSRTVTDRDSQTNQKTRKGSA